MVILKEPEDIRGQQILIIIRKYNLKSAIYNFITLEDVKITTLSNYWKKLLIDKVFESDFEGFEPQDIHRTLICVGENVTMQDIEAWLEENKDDPGYQILPMEETADSVLADKGI